LEASISAVMSIHSYMSVSEHTSFKFVVFRLRLTAVIVVITGINSDAFISTDSTNSTQRPPAHITIRNTDIIQTAYIG